MKDDLIQVRCPAVCVYVLRDEEGLHLIDGGFVFGIGLVERALRRRGWDQVPLRSILITHGHLDHTHNVAAFAAKYGCEILAPALDAPRYEWTYRYTGLARVCGALESTGRALFGRSSFRPHRKLEDGEDLPVWGGLRAIHLPGHTEGHMGFYSAKHELLFCGDLFASFSLLSYVPPGILNSCPELIRGSIRKALDLKLTGVAPQHCDRASWETHLMRLKQLADRLG